MKNSHLISIVYACVLALCSFTAQGAIITHTFNYQITNSFSDGADSIIEADSLSDVGLLSLPQFDLTLGELTSVRFFLDISLAQSEASATFTSLTSLSAVSGSQRLRVALVFNEPRAC